MKFLSFNYIQKISLFQILLYTKCVVSFTIYENDELICKKSEVLNSLEKLPVPPGEHGKDFQFKIGCEHVDICMEVS